MRQARSTRSSSTDDCDRSGHAALWRDEPFLGDWAPRQSFLGLRAVASSVVLARPESVGRVRTPGARHARWGQDPAADGGRRPPQPPLLERTLLAMIVCRSCGVESPDGFRFCPGCGSPLADPAASAPAPEERKVVTALFCDLVGFTATSESADPEDVDRMLTAYFALARSADRGATAGSSRSSSAMRCSASSAFRRPTRTTPSARSGRRSGSSNEAERLPGLAGAPLRLRVGINTGRGARPARRRPRARVSGSSPATPSTPRPASSRSRRRWGSRSGSATYEATKGVFDYEELPPATLKGKAEPVRVFHARSPRARLGVDLTRTHDGPYVGREIDLASAQGPLRQDASPGELRPARHDRRRARHRQEPHRRRAARPRPGQARPP